MQSFMPRTFALPDLHNAEVDSSGHRVVLATNNPKKLAELRRIVAETSFRCADPWTC